MAQLTRGANSSLEVNGRSPHHVVVGVSWEAPSTGRDPYDVDLSVLLCDQASHVPNEGHVIFASQLKAPTEAPATPASTTSILDLGGPPAASSAPATASQDRQDVEEIEVDLSRVPPYLTQIVFALTITSGTRRQQTFSQLKDVRLRVSDLSDGAEIASYRVEVTDDGSTSLALGELYRRTRPDGSIEWKVRALGQGVVGGLAELGEAFGVSR